MNEAPPLHHILVADDDAGVIDAYRRVFAPLLVRTAGGDVLDLLSRELFDAGESAPREAGTPIVSRVTYCRQGSDAVDAVREAKESGRPLSVAFLDMRMPPGPDGMETARRIRDVDANIAIVIVTGFSDHNLGEINHTVGRGDNIFYLTKPFEPPEIQQLATALSRRRARDEAMQQELAERIVELERLNADLASSEEAARRLALHDGLTGLRNRSAILAELGERMGGRDGFALLYVDLDRFKDVNDTLGHAVGDAMLREMGERMVAVVGPDGFAARLGGDEFAIIAGEGRADAMAEAILAACDRPFAGVDRPVEMRLSIGVAHRDGDVDEPFELMRRADVALYAAKAAGRGCVRAFDAEIDRLFLARNQLAADLQEAIASDQLDLLYQPIVAADGEICGVEALLRWNHPEHGALEPDYFVSIAEETHLVRDLGLWVMRRAFADAKMWPGIVTSINVSPGQFRHAGFVEEAIACARAAGVDPAMFEFEITESLLIGDLDLASDHVAKLQEAGFKLALDDFGTGYSSLNYLQRIAFDRLKIDRSYIQAMSRSAEAVAVVQSIVSLGQAFGVSITAEGVERADENSMLAALGCSQFQGFLFYRPLARQAIVDLARRDHGGGAPEGALRRAG